MARTTEEKAKRARDGAEDAVYKPVRGAKKPIRIDSETPERGTMNPCQRKTRRSSGGRSGKRNMSQQSPRTGGAPSAARATQG